MFQALSLTDFLVYHAFLEVTLHLLRHGVHLHDIVAVHIPCQGRGFTVTSLIYTYT